MAKNQKQIVNEYCQELKHKPVYVCTPQVHTTYTYGTNTSQINGFHCTLTIGDQSFSTTHYKKSKKEAELEAAKLAYEKLGIASLKDSKYSSVPLSDGGLPDPSWISIEKVEDVYQYLTDEILSQEFKAFLHCRAQEDKKDFPKFTVTEVENNGFTGYTASVTYVGVEYQSLGVMVSRKQAEQSAAEVCLRKIGDFPQVEKDKYTIQVYKGGKIHNPVSHVAYNKTVASLLQVCAGIFNFHYPTYRFKEILDGESKKYKSLLLFEGKMFESESPAETMEAAKQQAAELALNFLGIKEFQKIFDVMDTIYIKRNRGYLQVRVLSPNNNCPSRCLNWVFLHFNPADLMSGERLTHKKDTLQCIEIKKNATESAEKVIAEVLNEIPAIGGVHIADLDDLYVGQISNERKSDILVGNNQCSIPVYCENGEIMCTSKDSTVKLLPGQKICGLKSSYEVLYPSLRVYLKAESCEDLVSTSEVGPVVASCGVAVLMHDDNIEPQGVHILLSRRSLNKTFLLKARFLSIYLRKLISSSESQVKFDIQDFISDIKDWCLEAVELVSEMTAESIQKLMSLYIQYDENWGEIVEKEDNEILNELKTAAERELLRRTEIGLEKEVNDEEWQIPSSPFKHKFTGIGVTMENELQCTYRSIIQVTGVKVKLADLENSPFVDIPLENEDVIHSGDVCRYHLWRSVRREPVNNQNELLAQIGEEWNIESEGAEKRRRRQNNENPQQTLKRKIVDDGNIDVKKASIESKVEIPVAMEEDAKDNIRRPTVNVQDDPKHNIAVYTECKWFPLSEALNICPILLELSKDPLFKGQVTLLEEEAIGVKAEK